MSRAALEAEAQAAAEQAEEEGKKQSGVPGDKAQRNFTDAQSRIMPGPGGGDFLQAYNCQAVVDSAHQAVAAARATNQSSDKNQAVGMTEETIGNTGVMPRGVSADAGYYSAKVVDQLHALGVGPFIAPEQTRHGRVVPPAPRGRIPSHLSPRDRMRRKLQAKRGRQRFALRMETVEPVFGQLKQGRGFRHFLMRGLENLQGEWSLICTGHNLLKLFRPGRLAPGLAWATQLNRAPGMSTPTVGYDVPCTEPPRVGIVNRHESRTPIHHRLPGRLVSQYSDSLLVVGQC